MKDQTIQFKCEIDLKDDLEKLSKKTGFSKSLIIRLAINDFLKNPKLPKIN